MKRLVILNIESSQLAGFTNKGVKIYAKDILTNEKVTVSMTKRPETNQIALITDRVLKIFGNPRLIESWESVIKWGIESVESKLEQKSQDYQLRTIDAVTIDSNKTFYKSDAISFTKDGIIFHVYDFSNFQIKKLGRCSDFLAKNKVLRCFSKENLENFSFKLNETRPALSVNLRSGEVFRSMVTITDSYTFDDFQKTFCGADDVMKWGKSFSKILCEHLQVPFQHDVTRPLHSLAGVAILTQQFDLLEKITSNQNIEKTIDLISRTLEDFKTAVQTPSRNCFIKWTNINPLKSIQTEPCSAQPCLTQSEHCSKYSFSKDNASISTFESFLTAENISSLLRIDSIS